MLPQGKSATAKEDGKKGAKEGDADKNKTHAYFERHTTHAVAEALEEEEPGRFQYPKKDGVH